jgi:uncharacterized ferredoxin-like protein
MTNESTKYLDFIFVRMEAEIREKIAKEIEAMPLWNGYLMLQDAETLRANAAAIARGNND